MSEYTEAINWYTPLGKGYIITDELRWEIGKKNSALWVSVPINFWFDVSVPWFLRWLINPRREDFHKAACLHDYTLKEGWDRVTSAGVFAEALRADKVPIFMRLLMTVGVVVWKWT